MPDSFIGKTVATARRMMTAEFSSHAIETPELDARILIGAALELDLTGMTVNASRILTTAEADQIVSHAQRRLLGEPVARILGRKEFWGLDLTLSAATLIPRPDTETLVEAALDLLPANEAMPDNRQRRFVDIGTGSGAVLLALLSEWPDVYGVGTDIDLAALRTARANARGLGLADRAAFIAGDYTAALRGPFDLIVSNPPYIASADIETLANEVRDHDPRRALDGGVDGLDAYRTLSVEAVRLLRPGAALAVEVGQGQADDVADLMSRAGLSVIVPNRYDLAGHPRVVAGRLPNPGMPLKKHEKITWNIAPERLGSGYKIGTRSLAPQVCGWSRNSGKSETSDQMVPKAGHVERSRFDSSA